MWTCEQCGRAFANRNQTHTCAPLGDLDAHFARVDPAVRETFERFLDVARQSGPVIVLPEKTRIALQVRMSFAALMPRRRWLNGHLVLARPVASDRFTTVQVFSPRNVLHTFTLTGPDAIDDEFAGWISEAYEVGAQKHLHS